MMPFQMIAGGFFTGGGPGTQFDIALQAQNPPDYVWVRNRTQWGSTVAQDVQFEWNRGMAQASAQVTHQIVTTNALTSAVLTTGGFTFYDTANPPTFPPLAATAITNANPAVISMANTGTIAVGDIVRIVNAVGMQQISNMYFKVTAVTTNVSITIALNASGFASPATAASIIKFIPKRYYPHYGIITAITQAVNPTVTFSTNTDFTPGEEIGFRIGTQFGMSQLNMLTARVLTVPTPNTITVEIDTSGFTAFAYPTSAIAAAGYTIVPVAVPASSGVVPDPANLPQPLQPPGTTLIDAFDNRNTRVIHLGLNIFANTTIGDVFDWRAYKYDSFNGI